MICLLVENRYNILLPCLLGNNSKTGMEHFMYGLKMKKDVEKRAAHLYQTFW